MNSFQLHSCLLCVSFLWSFFCILLVLMHRESWFYIQDHKKQSLIYSPWTFAPSYFRRVQLGSRNNGIWPRATKLYSSDSNPSQLQNLEYPCLWYKHCKGKWVEEGLTENFELRIKQIVICLFMDMSQKKRGKTGEINYSLQSTQL